MGQLLFHSPSKTHFSDVGNLLFLSLAKLEATSFARGTQTVISGIVVGGRAGRGYFGDNFTSFAIKWKFAWRHFIPH